jgi:hypothetical protein
LGEDGEAMLKDASKYGAEHAVEKKYGSMESVDEAGRAI